MDHKLHLLVRLEFDLSAARIEVRGCLTADSVKALPPVAERSRSLNPRMELTLDLRKARHIDSAALAILGCTDPQRKTTTASLPGKGRLTVLLPEVRPLCRASKVLDGMQNEERVRAA